MLMKDYPRDIQEFVRERSKLLYNPKYGIDAQFLFTAQPEGADFWHEVSKGNLDVFYEKYPKKEECPKERLLKLNQDCNWTTFYSGNFMDEFLGFPNLNDIEVKEPEIVSDSIVNKVIESFKERSNVGIKKYGVTLDREDLSPLEWISHLQQELQDAILYAEKLKSAKCMCKSSDMAEDNESKTSYHLLKVEEVNIKSNFGHSIHRNFNQVCLEYSLDGKVVTLNIT